MAKKVETISLIDTFSEFKELKNIDRTTMVSVLEESFRSVIAKMFGTDENYDVIVNPDKGDFEIWRNREVVADEDLENPNLQIALSEAQKIDASYEVGEEVTDEVIFANFGRRAILNLRQTLASKILELEKDSIYNKYIDKVGNIINAEVYQIWKKEMLLLDDEGNELLLPKTEQIPSDFYRKGETARAVVARVDNKNNNPKIILSRTSPVFLQRLFEMEVPEINDGLITIKKIARIPGERAKIAVESYDDRIDPVGACVGVKGSRIHGIVRELRNENIDVIDCANVPSSPDVKNLLPAGTYNPVWPVPSVFPKRVTLGQHEPHSRKHAIEKLLSSAAPSGRQPLKYSADSKSASYSIRIPMLDGDISTIKFSLIMSCASVISGYLLLTFD